RAKELGLKFDSGTVSVKSVNGKKLQKRFLESSNQSIIDNHTPITSRQPEVLTAFKALYEAAPDKSDLSLFFPNDITGEDGKTFNESQLNATLQDIANGIPSVQAEKYLNEFEAMVSDGSVKMVNIGESVLVPFAEYMEVMTAAKKEVDEALNEGRLPIADDVAEQLLVEIEKEMSDPDFQDWYNNINLEDNGADQNFKENSQEQASGTRGPGSNGSRQARSGTKTSVSEDGTGSVLQEAEQEVAGFAPNARVGGIQVAPIIGGKPKDLSRIILDIGHGLKQNIFFSKVSRRAAGTYAPGSTAIKIKFSGDLDTTAHEIGHAIDDKYDIISDILAHPTAPGELPQFSKFGSKPPKGHPNPKKYTANEGFAEFLRAYIVNPLEAKAKAPKLFEIYESKVPDAAKKVIEQFSTDIRTWAGSTGRDITKANIQFKPEEKPGILSQIFGDKPTSKEFEINTWDKLAANFINPLRVFEKAFAYAKQVKGVSDVLPQDNPTLLARLLLGIDGKFGQVLKNGMIDSENNVLTDKDGKVKNLKWLLEPLDNTDVASVERDMEDVITYMVSERTVELGKRLGKQSVISGVGGGIFTDIEVAQKTLDEFNNSDPDRLARLKEASERYREMADDTLKYLVDKGRLAQDQYLKIKADNTQYVAMQRVLESEPEMEVIVYKGSGGKLTSVAEPLKKIQGSTKKIVNPYTSLLDTVHKSLKEADRNEVLRSFRDMLVDSRGMNQRTPKRLADVGVIAKEGDKNAITIFINGKPEKWKFQQDVYEALNGLDHDKYHIPGALKLYGSILRTMTTKFPTFALRNWVRDIQDRLIKSNDNSGFMDLFGNPEDWNEVERIGGLNAGYYVKSKEMYYSLMEEAMNQVAKKKGFILTNPERLKAVWHAYESVLFKSETSNRVAEYRAAFRQAKKEGMDDYNASLYGAFKSRDLMDFAVAGHVMKIVNQMIPFSNAAVQGMRSAAVRAKENPLGFLARTMIYSVGPQMLVWLWNHRDDEDAEEYENIPTYQRDLFWNIKIGPNNWLALPKPYELSVAGGGVDRAMSYSIMGNKKAFDGYGGTVMKSVMPFDEGTAFGPLKPIVENIANYDAFREKSIISPFENVLNLALRNTQTASRLGQVIQSAAGIDARKADHFIQSTFSYVGKTAMKLSDLGRDESKNKFDFTDIGIFKSSPGYNAAPVQEMMKTAMEYQLTMGREYVKFKNMSKEYFEAKGDEQKENVGKKLIDYSNELMDKWENEGIVQKKKSKAEAKRSKTTTPPESILP
ncbi:MAG: LPD38 domain-containing protein, partial [Segetibacter sp.]